jgi:AraC-like DNA-binding protein
MAPIPCNITDTSGLPARERFARWRDAMSATHEAALPADCDPARFNAFACGWNLGQALVIETRATAQVLSRSPRAIRADQIDHYLIRLQRDGRWRGEAGDRSADANAGTVMVLDMAQPTTALGTDIDNINVLLPRDVLDSLLPPFNMHGLVLRGAMAQLLRNHLVTLIDNLPHIPAAHAGDIARATGNLVAACLAPSRDAAHRARGPLALARFSEIRRYIDRHLGTREFGPDAICRALGLSRSTLYAACEPVGGVAALVRQRRLARLREILTDPRDRRPIAQIAYQHGFVSQAHFSRAFREAYGCSPREAREGALRAQQGAEPAGYASWIRQLGG